MSNCTRCGGYYQADAEGPAYSNLPVARCTCDGGPFSSTAPRPEKPGSINVSTEARDQTLNVLRVFVSNVGDDVIREQLEVALATTEVFYAE